ncbi:MAG: 2-C-methyl-D-erythritol 4-phosphate cytidylyltransferase, partial [Gammaproteobacteria bacterium]|nr:2-C-methyl-D-erythritol 4-phosphate cytidylyltransferase [Gammaproteobacteria bacterium]NIT62828.1 2-C-methyl-D-erythritol 4-phosphate cytidylyltransferase [Gammaproteobacteria bacterium]NIY31408.1 2-C-methyl-D-erythritol 4-phosphate cytidylyltransferase [Gammaproteobacteria bacterium]
RATDDAQLVEWQGGRVAMVPGDAQNLKVTTATDYRYGEWWLREGARTVAGETM